MSMLDAFFNKGFKAAKCKTLLKLMIPRIKLLRNRREIQIKQMRRDIAKLLETGQEATARIRVEHIIREENMMAAQEIIELFCELIAVRLPIIETQRECPLDLKEAISSVCFAAPRCADLPELQQVQMLFAAKYGREFISAAAELIPDCGVNRQIIELLSVRAPQPDVKMKLLKEIAEEHELDWDPTASETEYFKPPEDLLNGSTQFVNQSKVPLPKEKYEETVHSSTVEVSHEQSDSDSESDSLGLPEVPKVSLRPLPGGSGLEAPPAPPQFPPASKLDHETVKPSVDGSGFEAPPPPQAPLDSGFDHKSTKHSVGEDDISNHLGLEHEASAPEQFVASPDGSPEASVNERDEKQFSPFIPFQTSASASFSARQSQPPITLLRNKSDLNVDLQDVLAAAHAAAESAERAAASARSAASLATVRITELMNKNHKNTSDRSEQPLQTPNLDKSPAGMPQFDHQKSFSDTDGTLYSYDSHPTHNLNLGPGTPSPTLYDNSRADFDSPSEDNQVPQSESLHHQPQRLPSMEDDPYYSYPNLFTTPAANTSSK